MKIFKSILFIGFCILILSFQGDQNSQRRVVFGVSLAVNGVSADLSYALVSVGGNQKPSYSPISKDNFIKMASGYWICPANLERHNLFDGNEVVGGIFFDSVSYQKIPYCPALDSLWKLRYSYNPYQPNENGWAGEKYKPSAKQAIYLYENYGVYNINSDYFVDTNCWKILRDVCDPQWIAHYRSLR